MNITRLNGVKDVIIERGSGGNSGGGSGSNYKYYDCSKDTTNEYGELPHGIYLADSIKIMKIETGEIMITPEAYFDDGESQVLAIAYDMSKRIYIDGEWVDIKTFLEAQERFDFLAHQEITEEEFYRVPEDVVIHFRDYDKLAEVYETIAKNVFAKMPEDSVPVVSYWYDAPSLDIPMMECGYKSISVVVNSEGGTPTSDIIGRVFKQDSDFNTANWWQDGLDEGEVFYENVDATYFELKNQATGLCKIVFPDGTVKYMVRKLF